jgi:hypothetical protein
VHHRRRLRRQERERHDEHGRGDDAGRDNRDRVARLRPPRTANPAAAGQRPPRDRERQRDGRGDDALAKIKSGDDAAAAKLATTALQQLQGASK